MVTRMRRKGHHLTVKIDLVAAGHRNVKVLQEALSREQIHQDLTMMVCERAGRSIHRN